MTGMVRMERKLEKTSIFKERLTFPLNMAVKAGEETAAGNNKISRKAVA